METKLNREQLYFAAVLLLALDNNDEWNPEHEEACKMLGLDADNYRSRWNSQNWPPNMRGRMFERTMLRDNVMAALLPRIRESEN